MHCFGDKCAGFDVLLASLITLGAVTSADHEADIPVTVVMHVFTEVVIVCDASASIGGG